MSITVNSPLVSRVLRILHDILTHTLSCCIWSTTACWQDSHFALCLREQAAALKETFRSESATNFPPINKTLHFALGLGLECCYLAPVKSGVRNLELPPCGASAISLQRWWCFSWAWQQSWGRPHRGLGWWSWLSALLLQRGEREETDYRTSPKQPHNP